jgi:NADPH:quinone reductase-like Zn-dependent oxidoreductase
LGSIANNEVVYKHHKNNFINKKNMKAALLVATGAPDRAFRLQEMPDPLITTPTQVRIQVEAFGLNFADVVARLGQYQDCPPLPAVIGYEVVGTIESVGSGVTHLPIGMRVLAFTRFGGYATMAITDAAAVVPIGDMDAGVATALCTQYSTAYFAAEYITQLHQGEHVLIQSAAGGVGTALVQLAKRRGCIIYGTAGSDAKLEHIKKLGVDFPINYSTQNFADAIKQIAPDGKVDVIFDAVGGDAVRKGISLLAAGGRMVCYGAASMSQRSKNIFKTAKTALEFGIYHPAQFMMSSKSLMGVNMLRIADQRPLVLQQCLQNVIALAQQGELKPVVDGVYPIAQLAEAHERLETRQTMGKIAIRWV